MLEQKSIAVVIPAHDEEKLIGATISGVPGFVDRIIVVDDRSATARPRSWKRSTIPASS